MTTLEFTKKDVEKWQKTIKGNSAVKSAFKDWLTMHELLEEITDYSTVEGAQGGLCFMKIETLNKIRTLLEAK